MRHFNKNNVMKQKFLFLLLIFTNFICYSQTKNFIDQPYIEVKASVDTLVIPDKIFMKIILSENDTKDKISVEELENRMAEKLNSIGINVQKQLSLNDLTSNFKKYLLKQKDVMKNKTYTLIVYDAKTAGTVIQELEKINISNVNIDYAEYSKIEQLKNTLRRKASIKAKEIAKSIIEPFGQKVGNVIYASDKTQIQAYQNIEEVVVMGYSAKAKTEYKPIDIEFKKVNVSSEVIATFKIE